VFFFLRRRVVTLKDNSSRTVVSFQTFAKFFYGYRFRCPSRSLVTVVATNTWLVHAIVFKKILTFLTCRYHGQKHIVDNSIGVAGFFIAVVRQEKIAESFHRWAIELVMYDDVDRGMQWEVLRTNVRCGVCACIIVRELHYDKR
jgi:hypothetical protein